MKFSVIIPTYNSAASLPMTLDSIFAQTFDDCEVVVVDGASKDAILDVLKIYEEKFNGRLHWISEKDSGIYDAMNKGISLAQGEYLYFMGAGDVFYAKNILEDIEKELVQGSFDVVYGDVIMGNDERVYGGEFDRERLILQNISHQAIFYNKGVFEKLGKYNLKYKTLADWDFNMRWINDESIKSKYIKIIIAKFELGGSSKTFFDKLFYADFETNIKKYFPSELWKIYKEKKASEIRFVTSEMKWKLWEIKNKFEFALKSPGKFISKYIKK